MKGMANRSSWLTRAAILTIATGIVLGIGAHVRSRRPVGPERALALQRDWLQNAVPTGPGPQFGTGQMVNLYHIFAHLEPQQRRSLLAGQPLRGRDMSEPARYHLLLFLQHASHNRRPFPVKEAILRVYSMVVRSQAKLTAVASVEGREYPHTITVAS
jgi:hypothetical protein